MFEKNNQKITLQNVKVIILVNEITLAVPGYEHGIKEFENFIQNRLKKYTDEHNDPLSNSISNLSPQFHFGTISVQCTLEVLEQKKLYPKSVESFMEKDIIQ